MPPVTVMSDVSATPPRTDPSARPGSSRAANSSDADVVEHRAGDDGGNEGAGSDGSAELLDHHDELGEPEARAALVLGQVKPEPTQLSQVGPEGGKTLVLRFEQGARRAAGVALGQEV